jgi:hypothetical protein
MNFEALEEIYKNLPAIACQGKCQSCCTVIGLAPVEKSFLHQNGIGLPIARYSEEYDHLMCSYLTQAGRCKIHVHKPLICRLWGLTETMPCPFGCQPERVISQQESIDLMNQVDALKIGPTYFNDRGWNSDQPKS